MSQTPKSFEQIQAFWYGRLVLDGFVDIEDHTQDDRPLKRWTGLSMKRNTLDAIISQPAESPIISSWPDCHLSKADGLLNHPAFPGLCQSICKHGNNAATAEQAMAIWKRYSEGASTRVIAREFSLDHVTVFRIERRLTEWMNLLEEAT